MLPFTSFIEETQEIELLFASFSLLIPVLSGEMKNLSRKYGSIFLEQHAPLLQRYRKKKV